MVFHPWILKCSIRVRLILENIWKDGGSIIYCRSKGCCGKKVNVQSR